MRDSTISNLVSIATVPVILMNSLGGVVAGIWLLILGQWAILLWGLLIVIFGSFILSLFLMIPMIFVAPAARLQEKKKFGAATVFGALGLGVTFIVISAWCIIIFEQHLGLASQSTLIPLAIWSYGIATGELSYMASKERDNVNTMMTLLAAQIGFIIMLALFFLSGNLTLSIWGFYLVMLAAYVFEIIYFVTLMKSAASKAPTEALEVETTSGVTCPKCGKEDQHGGMFCVSCGATLLE